ncbi:hypothetical protein [Anaeromyxobacter terrae]|uniref:hypothetical protein n=1 Tax=Anaeromyxobacter terrae TaxID=2925406 RepID=UPI001F56197F|nr:hypothetical protein [Anaeromyxobacter sp. SG22]
MAAMDDMDEVGETLKSVTRQARDAVTRFADQVELERHMQERPMAVLGVAAAAGFVLGGGLWPVMRPFVKAAARAALSPTNLLAIGAALGALRAASGGEGEMPQDISGAETH